MERSAVSNPTSVLPRSQTRSLAGIIARLEARACPPAAPTPLDPTPIGSKSANSKIAKTDPAHAATAARVAIARRIRIKSRARSRSRMSAAAARSSPRVTLPTRAITRWVKLAHVIPLSLVCLSLRCPQTRSPVSRKKKTRLTTALSCRLARTHVSRREARRSYSR